MQNSQPLVSIVMPTYNRAYCINRALESVLEQTYPQWELLIVDNHSDDSTEALVKGYKDGRINLLHIDNDGVIARSRNKGIENANGKYIAFLDSDDWWSSEKLKVSVEALEKGVDIIYHDLFIISKKQTKPKIWRKIKTRNLGTTAFHDLISRGNALSTSSVVVSKALMLKINGFSVDPFLVGAEDYDAWIRLSKSTNKFKRLRNTLGYYWQGEDNYTTPGRTLNIIEYINRKYGKEFSGSDDNYLLNSASFQYILGRGRYQLNDLKQAQEHFSRVISSGEINAIFIKACVSQAKIILKKFMKTVI